jgi:hypothetical protein
MLKKCHSQHRLICTWVLGAHRRSVGLD